MSAALSPDTVATLMAKFRQGDSSAAGELVELCYPELRRLAASRMKSERTEHTWQPTVLVNELYLELVKVRRLEGGTGVDEQEKAAFLGFAGHPNETTAFAPRPAALPSGGKGGISRRARER